MQWYKRDCDAALAGMACLSPEARGIYNGILDMLYSRDGELPYDEDLIARTLSISKRTWRKLSFELLQKGKIWVTSSGTLMAKRVEKELKSAAKLSEKNGKTARKRWEKAENSNVINMRPMPAGMESLESRVKIQEETDAYASVPADGKADLFEAPKPKGKHRLPKQWEPSAAVFAQAVAKLGSEREAFDGLDEFKNYWWGCGRMMVEWDRVFANRVSEIARRRNRSNGYGSPRQRTADAIDGFIERYGHAVAERGAR